MYTLLYHSLIELRPFYVRHDMYFLLMHQRKYYCENNWTLLLGQIKLKAKQE